MKLITAIASISLAASAPAQTGDSPWLTEEMLRLVEAVLSSDVIIAGIVVGGSCWAVKYTVPKIVEYLQKGGEVSLPWGMKLGPGTPKRVGEIPERTDPDKTQHEAESGNAKAQFTYGLMFHQGEGVRQDDAEAVKWFRRAAEQGHPQAQNNLGVAYAEGVGIAEDCAEAAKWFRRAAERGIAQSQFNLGLLYRNGYGMSPNDKEAAKWFRRAAEQGHAGAQLFLAGELSKKDDAASNRESFVWYSLAALGEIPIGLDGRDDIAKRMSGDELESARNEVRRRREEIRRKRAESGE